MSEYHTVNNSAYWQKRYEERRDGWDLGKAAPPLANFFESHIMPPPPARVVVPGCGRGYEVLRLAQLGYEVIGVDFAQDAIDAGKRAAKTQQLTTAAFAARDFFVFAAEPQYRGYFDVAVEHTCYCAIDPVRRGAYADALLSVLRPGGLFVGLFWDCGFAGGPPFSTDQEELHKRFGPRFPGGGFEPASGSVSPRAGQEILVWGYRPKNS